VACKRLKQLRVSCGIAIDDISRTTCINPRYLKAIEEGHFSKLPGVVYARGYIREYARCLGVPFPDAVREYEDYLKINKGW
jgi:cytoskeletal protein RodZ